MGWLWVGRRATGAHSDEQKFNLSDTKPTASYEHGRQKPPSWWNGSRRGFFTGLIRSALIRQINNGNVYILARKSMTVRFYTHSIVKRAEGVALVDLGATENFMNLQYAKWLRLPIKRLAYEWNLFNVDGTENKSRKLKYYTDMEVQTGRNWTCMRFFLMDLWGAQGNTQILMVRSCAAKDWLEARMDWWGASPYHIQNGQHREGQVPVMSH
jgi:hypothetical protein